MEFYVLKPLFELDPCLTGTEYQNRLRITNVREYYIIIIVQMVSYTIVLMLLCRFLLCPAGEPSIFFNSDDILLTSAPLSDRL
jgi:hypothetical protein